MRDSRKLWRQRGEKGDDDGGEEAKEEKKGSVKEEQTAADLLVLTRLFVMYRLHYVLYSKRNRTAKVKAPPHPPLPPTEASRKWKTKPLYTIEKLHGIF